MTARFTAAKAAFEQAQKDRTAAQAALVVIEETVARAYQEYKAAHIEKDKLLPAATLFTRTRGRTTCKNVAVVKKAPKTITVKYPGAEYDMTFRLNAKTSLWERYPSQKLEWSDEKQWLQFD